MLWAPYDKSTITGPQTPIQLIKAPTVRLHMLVVRNYRPSSADLPENHVVTNSEHQHKRQLGVSGSGPVGFRV